MSRTHAGRGHWTMSQNVRVRHICRGHRKCTTLDHAIRLMAYYKFRKYFNTQSKCQRAQLRLEVMPFAVKASLQAYNFY